MSGLTPEQWEEVEKAWTANRIMQDAMNRQRRTETGEINIELEPAPEDPPVNDPAFQAELNTFGKALHDGGISYSQTAIAFDSIDALGYPLAEFAIKTLGPPAIGIVTAAVTGWIAGRSGRKARLKVGDVEAEARTPQEVERLLERGMQLQQRKKPDEQ